MNPRPPPREAGFVAAPVASGRFRRRTGPPALRPLFPPWPDGALARDGDDGRRLLLFTKIDPVFRPFLPSPGLGLLLVLTLVLAVGWISLFPASRRVISAGNGSLEQVPGISFISTWARDFLAAFTANTRRFTHAVLVTVHAEDVWLVGFLTNENLSGFKLGATDVPIFTPPAANVAGQRFLVKRDRLRPIEHLPRPT